MHTHTYHSDGEEIDKATAEPAETTTSSTDSMRSLNGFHALPIGPAETTTSNGLLLPENHIYVPMYAPAKTSTSTTGSVRTRLEGGAKKGARKRAKSARPSACKSIAISQQADRPRYGSARSNKRALDSLVSRNMAKHPGRRAIRAMSINCPRKDKLSNPQCFERNNIHNVQLANYFGIFVEKPNGLVYDKRWTPRATHALGLLTNAQSEAITFAQVTEFFEFAESSRRAGHVDTIISSAAQKMFEKICADDGVCKKFASANKKSCHVASQPPVARNMLLVLFARAMSVGVNDKPEEYLPFMALEARLLDKYGDRNSFLYMLHNQDHRHGLKMRSSKKEGQCLCCLSAFASRNNLISKKTGEYYKPMQRLFMQNKTSPAMLIWVAICARLCSRCSNSVSTEFSTGGMGAFILQMMRLSEQEKNVFVWLMDEKVSHGSLSGIGDLRILKVFLTRLFATNAPAAVVVGVEEEGAVMTDAADRDDSRMP